MKRSVLTLTVLGGAAVLAMATGCTSTVVFSGDGPIAIAGQAKIPEIKMDTKKMKAKFSDKKIEIDEKVQFEVNKADIKSESHQLLADVAQVMKEHPEVTLLAIEGHASADGDDNQNLILSDARSKAVMAYLVTQGIDAKRMRAEGFGEKRPLADNNTEEGRELNRRVEFNIVEKNGKPIEEKPADPKAGDKKPADPKAGKK
jgi:outer membrane protein OmpA-like peptidoglycan-associated protein